MHDVSDETLSAFVGGDLAEAEHREVAEHIARCPACAAAASELERLVSLAAELGPEPSEDLWPAIRAALRDPKQSAARDPRANAARILGLFGRLRSPILPWAVAATAVGIALAAIVTRPAVPGDPGDLEATRGAYLAAIERLESASDTARRNLPDPIEEKVADSLETVDRAIADVERALARAPDNADGQHVLVALYDEKLRILRAVVDASEAWK